MVIKFGELFKENITRKKIKPSDNVVFIGMQDVDENATIKNQSITTYSEVKSGFTYFEKNDVLVAKITPCFENGKGGFADSIPTDVGFGSTEFHILRALDNADPRYVYYQTKRPKLRLALEGEMVGSAGHRRVPFSALQNYELECRHTKHEQTAIANALSDVDNLIAALETLIAKKSAIKTAAMQQLLTGKKRLPAFEGKSEGESAGKSEKQSAGASDKIADNSGETQTAKPSSEFETSSNHNTDAANTNNQQTVPRPGYKHTELGEIPEDWEVRSVGGSCDLLTGYPFPSDSYSDHGIRLLRGSNVKRGNTDWSEGITQYWPKITADIKQYELCEGDIVISMDGSLVGRSFAQLSQADLPAVLLQRVARLRSNTVSVGFLKEWVCSKFFTEHCDSVKTVTAIPHISPEDIRIFRFLCPPTVKEQTAIANVLSDMDTELDALQQRLSKTKTIKQGMMQELLTGKTRLV